MRKKNILKILIGATISICSFSALTSYENVFTLQAQESMDQAITKQKEITKRVYEFLVNSGTSEQKSVLSKLNFSVNGDYNKIVKYISDNLGSIKVDGDKLTYIDLDAFGYAHAHLLNMQINASSNNIKLVNDLKIQLDKLKSFESTIRYNACVTRFKLQSQLRVLQSNTFEKAASIISYFNTNGDTSINVNIANLARNSHNGTTSEQLTDSLYLYMEKTFELLVNNLGSIDYNKGINAIQVSEFINSYLQVVEYNIKHNNDVSNNISLQTKLQSEKTRVDKLVAIFNNEINVKVSDAKLGQVKVINDIVDFITSSNNNTEIKSLFETMKKNYESKIVSVDDYINFFCKNAYKINISGSIYDGEFIKNVIQKQIDILNEQLVTTTNNKVLLEQQAQLSLLIANYNYDHNLVQYQRDLKLYGPNIGNGWTGVSTVKRFTINVNKKQIFAGIYNQSLINVNYRLASSLHISARQVKVVQVRNGYALSGLRPLKGYKVSSIKLVLNKDGSFSFNVTTSKIIYFTLRAHFGKKVKSVGSNEFVNGSKIVLKANGYHIHGKARVVSRLVHGHSKTYISGIVADKHYKVVKVNIASYKGNKVVNIYTKHK